MADPAARRRKLKFRAGHRGLRELDLYMEAFLAVHLERFDEAGLDQFEAILEIPDQTVYGWIVGRTAPPQEMRSPALDLLLAFRYPAPFPSGTGQDRTDPAG